jgi:hypothetical protein
MNSEQIVNKEMDGIVNKLYEEEETRKDIGEKLME